MSNIDKLNHLQIALQEISLATNHFSEENSLGLGGFGKVYKGDSEKHGIIAVKRLDTKYGQGDPEFKREIDLLSEYKHENVVSLVGFCDEAGEKILVYKFESNGSLDKHLHSKDLTWIRRLLICLDDARGLKYLHDDVGDQHRIIHRDVKSANILLDDNWNAKISDFGLSRLGPANTPSTFVMTNPCGTPGYIDPEYWNTGYLTKESDVFSFGVVLFEVLCGRLACVKDKKDGRSFYTLAQKHHQMQTLDKIIDPDLLKQINADSRHTYSTIAYECLKIGVERPTMNKVVEQLQKALKEQQKQESKDKDEKKDGGGEEAEAEGDPAAAVGGGGGGGDKMNKVMELRKNEFCCYHRQKYQIYPPGRGYIAGYDGYTPDLMHMFSDENPHSCSIM